MSFCNCNKYFPVNLKIYSDLIVDNEEKITESFNDMNLKEELFRCIYAYGFEKPSDIQQRAVLPKIESHDGIAQAQSGTGNTAKFSEDILRRTDLKINEVQGLV